MDLYIFPTNRAVRNFYQDFKQTNTLLPQTITVGEFEKRVLIYDSYTFIDAHIRAFLLRECTAFDAFKKLHVGNELFTFLENSEYILRFFDELTLESVDIQSLTTHDTYAEFSEHLDILHKIYDCYLSKLQQRRLIDKVNITQNYRLNRSYIEEYKTITLFIEGFMSKHEWHIFTKVAEVTPLFIKFHYTRYSQKMRDQLNDLGFDIQEYGSYTLGLHDHSHSYEQPPEPVSIDAYPVAGRALQVAFVKQKIYEMVQEGIEPSQIVVITPDEYFATTLRLFDTKRNCNYAMGIPFDTTPLYRDISALYESLCDYSLVNRLKIKRLGLEAQREKLQDLNIQAFVELFLEGTYRAAEKEKLQSVTEAFKNLFTYTKELHLKENIKLLLNALQKEYMDDIGGGKITVLGALESRGVRYEGVIVVDFNDHIVPKLSHKDIFLSSSVRKHAGLPTAKDREDLQRYYYDRLFSKAKRVAIAYVDDESSTKARFLDQLNVHYKKIPTLHLHRILTPNRTLETPRYPEIEIAYDFKSVTLSAQKIKTYLSCKRQYYYRYIADKKEAQTIKEERDARDMGILIHSALRSIDHTMDQKEIMESIKTAFNKERLSLKERFELDLWIKRLQQFAESETRRFENGVRILYKEKRLECAWQGFRFEGYIDRIDAVEGQLMVIDYKSGRIVPQPKDIERQSDFQLPIYRLLAATLGDIYGAYYYDLHAGELIEDQRHEERDERLQAILTDLAQPKHNFAMCESLTVCAYCAYKILCGRDHV
jgi:RecB family exonuclease